ncbi:MAG: TetR/AcrR family transcriptional regulator [Bacilli bacterium]
MNKSESKYFNTALLMDEALLFLLDKKEYEFITVKEVCHKAGVSRSTFYLHYETMDDLLRETIQLVNKKFSNSFNEITERNDLTTSVLTNAKYLKPYLLFIKNNLKVYQLMHKKSELFSIEESTQKLYASIFAPALTNFEVNEEEQKYIFAFYCCGTLGIIKQWIKDKCKDDIDLIIDLISRNTFTNRKTK